MLSGMVISPKCRNGERPVYDIVEELRCLAVCTPVGNRIRFENGEVVFEPSDAEISFRDK